MPLAARLIDITTCAVDAIVNAANESLSRGGGVCGAIHRAAGPQLALACAALAPCPTGEARITPGFLLPARFVIHAVGPVWRGGTARESALLTSAYRAALDIAEERALHALAVPAISTGIYGYPAQPAATIAVGTVTDFLATSASVRDVLFACFDGDTLEAYRALGVPG
jgi:O-acetyl-ADP-ribose deacetylase